MAYETALLDTQPPNYDYRGDSFAPESDGLLGRPYTADLPYIHEDDLGLVPGEDTFDALTAPLAKVIAREYASERDYYHSPIAWDRQAEQAHHRAFAQTTALRSMRRVCEYRAQQPTDTQTMQLRIPRQPSSIDTVLAELRELKSEIATQLANPPSFKTVQTLQNMQHHPERLAEQPRSRFQRIKTMGATAARQFVSRMTRQAVII